MCKLLGCRGFGKCISELLCIFEQARCFPLLGTKLGRPRPDSSSVLQTWCWNQSQSWKESIFPKTAPLSHLFFPLFFPFPGRVSFFSSGSENLHRVERVTWGTRYAITVSFTCDPAHAISDPTLPWGTRGWRAAHRRGRALQQRVGEGSRGERQGRSEILYGGFNIGIL